MSDERGNIDRVFRGRITIGAQKRGSNNVERTPRPAGRAKMARRQSRGKDAATRLPCLLVS